MSAAAGTDWGAEWRQVCEDPEAWAEFTAQATGFSPNGQAPVLTPWGVARQVWYPGMDESKLTDAGRAAMPVHQQAWAEDLVAEVRREKLRQEAKRVAAGDSGWAPPRRASITMREFLAGDGEEEDQIQCTVPGTLPQGCRLVLTGEEGRGKSTLIRWVSGCHAAGVHPWTGERYEGGTVLLIDAENPPALLRLRLAELAVYLEKIAPGAQEAMLDRLIVESQPAGFDLSAQAWAGYLGQIITDRRPQLVSGGPVYKLSSESPKSEEAFGAISSVLERLQVQYEFSLAIESHPRQQDQDGGRPEFPYGNSGWRRWPDMGFYLSRRGDVTDWRGNRYGENAPWPSRLIRVPGSNIAWEAVFTPQPAAGHDGGPVDVQEKIGRVVAEVTRSPGISQKALRAAVGGQGNQWIDAAIEAGAIAVQRHGQGKANEYHPVAPVSPNGTAPGDGHDWAALYDMTKTRRGR